jgi:hypothetical protein
MSGGSGMKCQTQFWKGTTQKSFQQSLVEIGSVVSEEKILLKFHPPLFSIFSLVAILVRSLEFLGGPLPKLCLAFHTSEPRWLPQPNLI